MSYERIEERRFQLQQSLDGAKSQEQRNVLGQFSTPFLLARDITNYAVSLLPKDKDVVMLEPACGTGVFFTALQAVMGKDDLSGSIGFEVDPHYFAPSSDFWRDYGVELKCEDFLSAKPFKRFPLLIANPPYSRHHHIDASKKTNLQDLVQKETGLRLSGLSSLYCYFLMLSVKWLEEDGLSCWLIPSEFMDVNYGIILKKYLLEKVDLIRIHRFEAKDLQFSDALVTSSIVVFRNRKPSSHPICFSIGGSMSNPATEKMLERTELDCNQKWTHYIFEDNPKNLVDAGHYRVLGDYFEVKRGIATGSNSFFIVNEETISRYDLPMEYLTPILPAPRKMNRDTVTSHDGIPELDEKLFLFSTDDSVDTISKKYPRVLDYIKKGEKEEVNKKYICSRHTPWYSCEKRKSAPFVIPYMGRGENGRRMFRFILNQSDAIATNGYLLMYPKPEFSYLFKNFDVLMSVWEVLNSISTQDFERNGRTYGGGLHKMEPRELLSIPVKGLDIILKVNVIWAA